MVRTAGAVVFVQNENDGSLSYLEIERGTLPYKGEKGLPAGHIENGETLEQAVERELSEETGIAEDKIRDEMETVESDNGNKVTERSDEIFDPRYEGRTREEYLQVLRERGFEPAEIDWLLDNAGKVETRDEDHTHYVLILEAPEMYGLDAGGEPAEVRWRRYSDKPDNMAFGQQKSLEWSYENLSNPF